MVSLSRVRYFGLHEGNDPEESGQEYGISNFDMDENIVNSIDSDQHVCNLSFILLKILKTLNSKK